LNVMIRNIIILCVFCSCLGFGKSAFASCGKLKAYEAIETIETIEAWENLYGWYKKYGDCNFSRGEIAESLNDIVAKILANRKQDLAKALAIFKEDKSFEEFVLANITATADWDDLSLAAKNVKADCPKSNKVICTQIYNRAKQAEKEARNVIEYQYNSQPDK
jgi:hypothetical protein